MASEVFVKNSVASYLYSSLAPLSVTARLAGPADIPFLLELYTDSRREEVTAWGWGADMAIGFLVMQHCCRTHAYETEYPNAQGYILAIQGALIGHLLLESSTELEIRLVDLAILTPWRGRGIGSAVIEALKCIASDRAVPLCLSVNRDNRASGLYTAHGFVEIDRGGVYINMAWKAPEYGG